MNIWKKKFDILVLGAGLSGLRAALSASCSDPRLNICVVSSSDFPCGSSFKNLNKKLGMQLLITSKEKEHFINRAIEIGSPGYIKKELVEILAEESEERFQDLKNIGVKFELDHNRLVKHPGCFDAQHNTAVIINDLNTLYLSFYKKLKEKSNVLFLFFWMVLKLLKDPDTNSICGAVLLNKKNFDVMFVHAKSIILAIGGSSELFPWSIASSESGIGISLLKEVGAKLENLSFFQFLWLDTKTFSFFSFSNLLESRIILNQEFIKIPSSLYSLIPLRITHCPISNWQRDRKIDEYLVNLISDAGIRLVLDNNTFTIMPFAQAQNGGAIINKNSMTTVLGLFSVGECATGMHGADRIGGAMILATQVFGHRAGCSSALWAKEKDFLSDKLFTNLMNDFDFKIVKEINDFGWNRFYSIFRERGKVLPLKAIILRDLHLLKRAISLLEELLEESEFKNDFLFSLRVKGLKLIFEHCCKLKGDQIVTSK